MAGRLAAAGYDVDLRPFDYVFWEETGEPVLRRVTPEPREYVLGEDFLTMAYSGAGDVTGDVVGVDLVLPASDETPSTSGCEDEDFADFPEGAIALLQRGTCPFGDKAARAAAAGAAAAVIFNEGQQDRTELLVGSLGSPVDLPVVGTTFAAGAELAAEGTTAQVRTQTVTEPRSSYDVLAQTPDGRGDSVVMVGAHLDSVAEGPGINDNGSGSAVQLEVALQLAEADLPLRNAVRFAWWSAEEDGLVGSSDYVASRSPEQLAEIALYLNLDMVASPNPGYFVYDGDDSDAEGAGPGPDGSAAIESVFTDYFDDQGLQTRGTDFNGRSDYGPFIAAGIPAGGLFTGAEDIKTPEQAELFGGTAGEAFDPCYHLACDTLDNLDADALDANADAVAHAVATFALTTEPVNARAARPGTSLAVDPRQDARTTSR